MKKTLKEEMLEAIEKETLDSWTTANGKDVRVVYTNDFVTYCTSIAEKHIKIARLEGEIRGKRNAVENGVRVGELKELEQELEKLKKQ